MYNPGEDDIELDRLSREAAAGFEVPIHADWQKMQAQLDKAMPVEKKRRFIIFWWILPVLLLGGSVFSYYAFKKQLPENVVSGSTIPSSGSSIETHPSQKEVVKATNPGQEITEKNKAEETPSISIATSPIPAAISRNKAATYSKQALSRSKSSFLSPTESNQNNIATFNNAKKSSLPPVAGNASNNNTNTELLPAGKSSAGESQELSTVSNGSGTNNIQAAVVKPEPVKENNDNNAGNTTATEQTSTVVNTKHKKNKEWGVAIVAGVDESTVKLKYGYDPGYNVGLIAGFYFSDKISLHSGVIYTQKNYKMAGVDFTAPKGSWVANYKLETVEGYCRMWEVPLLLRYAISSSAKKSFFLSTGLSSYFMTAEDYDYAYMYNGRMVVRNSAYHSTDTHVLSIAHFSAGFENRISRNLFLEVEPYAKIPLGGVGFGNIKLSSFGLNFALQHRQSFKK